MIAFNKIISKARLQNIDPGHKFTTNTLSDQDMIDFGLLWLLSFDEEKSKSKARHKFLE